MDDRSRGSSNSLLDRSRGRFLRKGRIMIWVGIDPGKHGAVATIEEGRRRPARVFHVQPIPVIPASRGKGWPLSGSLIPVSGGGSLNGSSDGGMI